MLDTSFQSHGASLLSHGGSAHSTDFEPLPLDPRSAKVVSNVAPLYGTAGDDLIEVGFGNSTIFAGDGKNVVLTGNGNDLIYTGSGNDLIEGGNGRNTIFAGDGTNLITVGNGKDLITSGSGSDFIDAGDGHNNVFAGDGNNRILTGKGNDLITAGSGNDTIYSGAGNDIINAGGGTNIINVGTGEDAVILTRGSVNKLILEGGTGSVTVLGFNSATDKLRLGESLQGKTLKFVTQGSDTLVKSGNDLLATLKNVESGSQALIDSGPLYRYVATDLGSLSTSPNGSVTASTINDFGVIAGRYETGATYQLEGATQPVRQGFVWDKGTQTALTSTGIKNGQSAEGAPNGAAVTLLSPNIRTISNTGLIVGSGNENLNTDKLVNGSISSEGDIDRALLWRSPNDFTIYDFGQEESYFFDTNSRNQNAGRQISSTSYIEPIYWAGGSPIGLSTLGGNGGTAQGINDKGQLVGAIDTDGIIDANRKAANTAALWERDASGAYQLTNLGTFGSEQATLRDINNAGQIIGVTSNGSGNTATSNPFLYKDGEYKAIGSLGGKTGSVNGINEFGEVVGASQLASGTNHGYVYIGGKLADLNNLVTTPITYNGAAVTLTSAVSINNFGDIVATGTYTYKDPVTGLDKTGTRSYRLQTA